MHPSQTSVTIQKNQSMFSSFPQYYFNQNPKTEINFIQFPHFHNETPTVSHHNLSSSFIPLSSSQQFNCKQEDPANLDYSTFSSNQISSETLINVKNEACIQTKYEDNSIYNSPVNNNIKIEVKREDDQHPTSVHNLSKKIKKKAKNHSNPQSTSKKSIHAHKKKLPKKKTRQTWTIEEEVQVLELMKKHGTKWAKIASCMKSRNGKQVRDHYLNSLAPDINRGVWTEEEDQAILFYYEKFGAQWCKIAECVPGRTETSVKGRFYTNLKQKRMMKDAKVEIIIDEFIKEEEEI